MTYDEWFNELEGFCLRCERFYDDVEVMDVKSRTELIETWLKAAYEVGYSQGRDEC